MKKLTLIPEALPVRQKKQRMYEDALMQFKNLDIESARIDDDESYASSIICSINSVIKNCDEYRGLKAVMREGKAYLAKTSALDDILKG